MKAGRNRTIDLTVDEGRCYLEKCISIKEKVSVEEITDKTILGDAFSVLQFLPEKFVDLMIVDPPYNLDKDFHGNKFKRTSDDDYIEYTETWVKQVLPLRSMYAVTGDQALRSPVFSGNIFIFRTALPGRGKKGAEH